MPILHSMYETKLGEVSGHGRDQPQTRRQRLIPSPFRLTRGTLGIPRSSLVCERKDHVKKNLRSSTFSKMSAAGNVDTATFSNANAEAGTREKYFRATEAFGVNSDLETSMNTPW